MSEVVTLGLTAVFVVIALVLAASVVTDAGHLTAERQPETSADTVTGSADSQPGQQSFRATGDAVLRGR